MNRRIVTLGTAGLLALVASAVSVLPALPAAAAPIICDQFGITTVSAGRYIVNNNNWGDTTTQCIDVNQTGPGFTVTTASHNKPTNGAPGSYPSIFFGCHYANCSAGSGLPLQASAAGFNAITTSVNMTYPGGGVWDAAYDIWFDPTPRTDGQNTGAEVMIWLNKQGSIQPVGSQVGTVSINGATWNVWEGNIGWNVISYVRQSATSSINFTVNDFYTDAINRGFAQRSWYLTSIQAGFEPWVGQTGLAVNSFSVTTAGGGGGGGGGGGTASCGAAYRVTGAWQGAFQGEVVVSNTGSATLNGWTATITFATGATVTQLWGGTATIAGNRVTVKNLSYNGSLTPGGSTTVGFLANTSGSTGATATTTCTSP